MIILVASDLACIRITELVAGLAAGDRSPLVLGAITKVLSIALCIIEIGWGVTELVGKASDLVAVGCRHCAE